jgi:hypothetical protein
VVFLVLIVLAAGAVAYWARSQRATARPPERSRQVPSAPEWATVAGGVIACGAFAVMSLGNWQWAVPVAIAAVPVLRGGATLARLRWAMAVPEAYCIRAVAAAGLVTLFAVEASSASSLSTTGQANSPAHAAATAHAAGLAGLGVMGVVGGILFVARLARRGRPGAQPGQAC